ncbi:MAG TPA: chemotaxis protein CheW [Candidatus Angelobacter sp.]|nr:chemotaxis protein CheW [Candidatus Angelobacter sp.]
MDEIVKEFIAESSENLDRMDRELVDLEKDPTSGNLLASIFRTIHTIKGTAGFLNFDKLGAVAHVGENLLGALRDGKIALTPAGATALLGMIDAIRQMLATIEATETDGENNYEELVAELSRLLRDGGAPAETSTPVAAMPTAAVASPTLQAAKPSASVAQHAAANTPKPPTQEAAASSPETRTTEVSESSVRVDVNVLDELMNLVGELVLARNRILQCALSKNDQEFLKTAQPLNMITTNLRKRVMKARMQPVSNVFGKFPRVVRDVALSCGKQVEIIVEGGETELDRTIIEAIKDPLTHLVRNSVDHGIETPEVRMAKGKPAKGALKLKALHESGYVTIEIADDGGGINREAVKKKALEKNLISAGQAARMSDREVFKLIFLPGFSTAAKITNVSGRGVGMDVVRTNIEKVNGTVEVDSTEGEGTRIKIKIPLTLTIIPVLMVKSAGERFAIPQVNLLELVRLRGNEVSESIEMLHNSPVCRLRNYLLPLVFLGAELGQCHNAVEVMRNNPEAEVNIAVLHADNNQFGLVVDAIEDTEEIVVKPIDDDLRDLSVFAGTTIRGNGEVALILDVMGLGQRAHAVSASGQLDDETSNENTQQDDIRSLLLFKAGDEGAFGVPADAVVRLEKFPASSLERSAQQDVVRYRGEVLRLVNFATVMGRSPLNNGSELQVLVCEHEKWRIGLIIDEILDVVREKVVLQEKALSDPRLSPAILGDRVVDLLDMQSMLAELATSHQMAAGGIQ